MTLETKNYKEFKINDISFDDFHQANRCLPGDTVTWDGSKCNLVKRANHRTLVGVLELNSKYLYGHTSRNVPIYLFHPLDSSYPPMRVGCSERDTSKNQLALVQFSDWTEKIPRGNLQRLLGPVGSLAAEHQALLWLYAKPELAKLSADSSHVALTGTSLEEGQTINIDPQGCKDIDDVLTLIPRENGWQMYITIADVAAAISEDSTMDFLASQRLQTVYVEGEAVLPMLPRDISEYASSLIPGEKRQGVSLKCFWDGNHLEVQGFEEVVITNQKSYTYESIYTADFPVHILKDIASYLKKEETNDSHEWIEQLMLLYNIEGAKVLLKMKAGMLRTHKPVKKDMLESMQAIHPDLRILAFESAKYEPVEEGKVHATLGSIPYTHLSSPLRRYADLVNQRVLKAYLHHQTMSPTSTKILDDLNKQQKNLKHLDRAWFFLDKILEQTAGVMKGVVVESTDTKTKLYIPSWKRIIKTKSEQIPIGTEVDVEFYADIRKVSWKERIVFRIKQEHESAKDAETNNKNDENTLILD
jgi:exoribonuclease R